LAQPLVTIVTPSFNQGKFVEETILSVLNQTYKNIEYIFVDGGSNDETMQIVEKYHDKIDVIIHEKDNGQADAINKGFKLSKGELVGWINSDDILYPDCVEEIVKIYNNHPNGAIYYGSKTDFIDIDSAQFKTIKKLIPNMKYLLNNNYSIIQQGSFYNLSKVKECGNLDEELNYCMDLDLWLKLLKIGEIYSYDLKPLAAFRFDGNTKTMTGGYKFLREIRKTLLKHGAKYSSPNIIRSYWYELKYYMKKILVK